MQTYYIKKLNTSEELIKTKDGLYKKLNLSNSLKCMWEVYNGEATPFASSSKGSA